LITNQISNYIKATAFISFEKKINVLALNCLRKIAKSSKAQSDLTCITTGNTGGTHETTQALFNHCVVALNFVRFDSSGVTGGYEYSIPLGL
jgi:hypothetical protein